MADNTMLIVLLLGGAAFFAYSQGMIGGGGGGGTAPAPEPEKPADQPPAGQQQTPLPTTMPSTTNIYNLQRPPTVIVQQPSPTVIVKPVAVTPYNRFVIMNQLSPQVIDVAYTRVSQYIVYFKTGRKGPVDWRWITFARDRARMAVHKSGKHKLHGKFADKLIEVAYYIQHQPQSRNIEIIARDAANIFISLEQADPQLLIRVS